MSKKKKNNFKKRNGSRSTPKVPPRITDIYTPQIIEVQHIDGMANETIAQDSNGFIVQRAFLTSLDERFPLIANNLLGHFFPDGIPYEINSIMIRLKNQTEAYIYNRFPVSFGIRAKGNIAKGTAVMDEQIADIISVYFEDDTANLNPEDGEQFVWLFRSEWIFGLYFDLTSELKQSEVLPYLGTCWKHVNYLGEYKFMASTEYFERMIGDGWFPFVALRGSKFKKLMTYYEEDCKHKSFVDSVVDSFDEETLDQLTQYWWNSEHFACKRQMLSDAINAYNNQTYTLAGKALSTELEGILRYAYNLEIASTDPNAKQKPRMFDLQKYLKDKSQGRYSLTDSLCFPAQFIEYLKMYTFQGFDLAEGDIPEGRHSVAHGVTPDSMYTKEFALKAILALDNAYYFLGDTATTQA